MLDREAFYALMLVLLAAVGGLLGSAIRMLDTSESIQWGVIIIETLASAFSGVIVMLLCQAIGLSIQMTGVVVGVCGWFGGRTTMLWLEKRVRHILEGGSKK